jgi:hypothetical protein
MALHSAFSRQTVNWLQHSTPKQELQSSVPETTEQVALGIGSTPRTEVQAVPRTVSADTAAMSARIEGLIGSVPES